jgi:hypothetical protein
MAHSVLLKGPSNYAADLRLGKHRYGVELNFLFGCPVWSGKPTSLAWGAVAGLVGIECGVVSGVINLESSGVETSDWRPRHDEHYHEA